MRPVVVAMTAASLIVLGVPSPSRAAWSTNPLENNPVSLALGDQRQPAMTPDGQGGTFVVFRDTRDSAATGAPTCVYTQHLDGQGNPLWPIDGVKVSTAQGYQGMDGQNAAALAADGLGGAFVAIYVTARLNIGPIRVKLQHLNSQGEPVWGDSGISVTTGTTSSGDERLLADGNGGVFLTWSAENQIRAQHFDAAGTPLWGSGTVACTSLIPQSTQMVSDGSGGIVLSWEDYRPPGDADVYAQRIDASGAAVWAPNGVPISTAASQQLGQRTCSDGAGGAIIAWWDTGTPRVSAQRVTGAGAAVWASNGIRLTTHESPQFWPKMASDGTGGAIIAWVDQRTGTTDYYAQRLDGSGARIWGDEAKPLCAAPFAQRDLEVIADGEHGLIGVWADDRHPGTRDLYAQRLGANGAPIWAVDGILIGGLEPGSQEQPSIVPTAGGAIVAFADWRGGSADLYAQAFSLDGELGNVVADVDPRVESGPARGVSVAPLPAFDLVTFSIASGAPGLASLSLFDTRGRLMRRLEAAAGGADPVRIRWDLRDQEGHSVGAGVYLARITLGREVLTARVVVVR